MVRYYYFVYFDVGIFCFYFLVGVDDDYGVFIVFFGIFCGGMLWFVVLNWLCYWFCFDWCFFVLIFLL